MATKKELINLLFFAGTSIFFRLIPHPPHLTLFGGLALCSGATVSWGVATVLILASLIATDFVYGMHSTMPFVYGAFLLITLLGRMLRQKRTATRLTGASLASSLIFFVISNFGVWLTSGMYSLTLEGLTKTFCLALPFYRADMGITAALLFINFTIGTVASTMLFFGVTGNWRTTIPEHSMPEQEA